MLSKVIAVCFIGLLNVFALGSVVAGEKLLTEDLNIPALSEGWSVGVHWGHAIENTVESLEAFQPYEWDFLDYQVISVGFRKKILSYDKYFSIYTELNSSYIYGDEDYAEFFVTPTVSWDLFPWDDYIDTSASVGVGLSYTTKEADLDESGEKLMASMIFELEFAVPEDERWSFYTRLHHRSSAYGTFSDGGGSNFPSIGLRFRLN